MTRMWMGDPRTMCRNHLLGEHKEIHQLIGQLRKKLVITGYIQKNCIEVSSITSRHDALVREMERRGYRHLSPVPGQSEIDKLSEYLPEQERSYVIDVESSDRDRYHRCCNCCPEGIKEDKMKKVKKFEEITGPKLKKALYKVLRCDIQHDCWPCGTCFFSLSEKGLDNSDWQSLLYYRGDHGLQHLDNLPKMWKRRITKIYNICCDRINKE